MKPETRTPDLEPGMAELFVNLPSQTKPFVIRGYEDELASYAEELQAYDKANPVHSSPKPKTPAVEAVRGSGEILEGRKATIHAKLYDMVYKGNMYQLLQEKRQRDRDLAMATRLGLLSVEEVYCRKHESAVAKLRNL